MAVCQEVDQTSCGGDFWQKSATEIANWHRIGTGSSLAPPLSPPQAIFLDLHASTAQHIKHDSNFLRPFATCRAMSRVNGRLGFIEPQLATLVEQPPMGAGWIHEIKHDGYRTQLVIERGAARAYTRNGFDWSDRYPGIIRAAAKLPLRSAILDGEVVVQDAEGISDFEALSSAIRWQPERLLFYAFDLLHLDGKYLRESTLLKRRAQLKKLLGDNPSSVLQFSEGSLVTLRRCFRHVR
jgi:ATP-dependent DNA ligase